MTEEYHGEDRREDCKCVNTKNIEKLCKERDDSRTFRTQAKIVALLLSFVWAAGFLYTHLQGKELTEILTNVHKETRLSTDRFNTIFDQHEDDVEDELAEVNKAFTNSREATLALDKEMAAKFLAQLTEMNSRFLILFTEINNNLNSMEKLLMTFSLNQQIVMENLKLKYKQPDSGYRGQWEDE